MPSPRKGENQTAFISRCVSSKESKNSFPDQPQRVAFCHSQWKNRSKSDRRDEILKNIKDTLDKKGEDGEQRKEE